MTKEHWMRDLSLDLRKLSIINLAIPGSHNSMTYGINNHSKPAPDAVQAIKLCHRFLPCFIPNWSKNQSSCVLEQLHLGVRYFDLRIAHNNGKFFYCHGVYAMEVFEPLRELRQFLYTHPHEIVVLDLQHCYAMDVSLHQRLIAELIQFFKQLLYTTTDGSLLDCSLTRCAQLERQVLLIYRRCPVRLPVEFWPSSAWPTPWPDTDNMRKLLSFLKDSLSSRQPQEGFVSQCLITPSGSYIARHLFTTLQNTAKQVNEEVKSWILEQVPGPFANGQTPHANVFLADFVNLKDGQFCNWVVELNTKLETDQNDRDQNDSRAEVDTCVKLLTDVK